MSTNQEIGLQNYAELFDDKVLARLIRLRVATNKNDYDGFVDCLYEQIDHIFSSFQAAPQRRCNDSEDKITDDLVVNLRTAGFDANHDQDSGGHVDVTVKAGDLTWIGEAKIYRQINDIYEGFLQLTTRYRPASGNFDHNKAGMLIYLTTKPNAKAQIDTWRAHIRSKNIDGYQDRDCPKNRLAFHSEHTHEVSGLPFFIRHMPLMLYHQPQDKSGRSRKTRSTKKAAAS